MLTMKRLNTLEQSHIEYRRIAFHSVRTHIFLRLNQHFENRREGGMEMREKQRDYSETKRAKAEPTRTTLHRANSNSECEKAGNLTNDRAAQQHDGFEATIRLRSCL